MLTNLVLIWAYSIGFRKKNNHFREPFTKFVSIWKNQLILIFYSFKKQIMEKINTHPVLTFKIIFVLCFMVMQIGAFAGQCDTVNIIANAGEDVAISNGADTTLTATGGTSYLWSTGETTPSITVSPTETSRYIVTVADENGCSDTDTVVVSVGCMPIVSVNGGGACVGDTIAIEINTTTLLEACNIISYHGKLHFDHTRLQYIGVDIEGTLSDSSFPLDNLIEEDTLLFASLYMTSKRFVGMGTLTKLKFKILEPGIHPVKLFEFVYNGQEQQINGEDTITGFALPVVIASEDVDISNGADTTLTATGGTSYLWSTGETTPSITVSPTETTRYTVTVFNENGCSDTDTVVVSVGCMPIVSVNGGEVCQGDTITVSISTSEILESCGLDNYQLALRFDSAVLDYIGYDRTGTLNETARIDDFDVDTMVRIVALPGLNDVQLIGAGDLIKLNFLAVNPGNSYLNFITDYFRFNGILDTNLMNGSVTVHAPPVANPSYQVSASDPVYYNFEANALSNATGFNWDFGDSTFSSEANPVHMFGSGGANLVILTITSDKGCTSNDTLTNQFTAPDYFYIRGNVDAGGVRVNNGKAIAYTIIDGNYYAVDTTDIVNGQYVFYSVPGGQYIVYAIPERSETGYVPTYYGDKTLWEDAFVLNLNSGEGVENVDISLAETANASGNSQITGTFLWEKMQSNYAGGIFSDPVTKSETSYVAEGLVVVLYDDTYEPVQWVATDTNGHYAFDGLESGTYYLKAEAPGYIMDYIELTVNQQLTFNMAVQDDGIVAGIGTMTVRQQESAMVYPNPVYASSFLTVSGIPAENLHVKIYTSTGILQKHESFKGKTDVILKQSDFSPGFYFYKIYNTKECIVKGSFIVK
jgi:CBS domain-containing protein